MVLLALDAAPGSASAAILTGGKVLAREADFSGVGRLAVLAERVLRAAGLTGADLTAVAASIGPGSFTGIRTALALASGIGLAAGTPAIGVSVGEALAALLGDPSPRALWVAINSRRGWVFLETAGGVATFEATALPLPHGPILLAGDAAGRVAGRLRRAGADVQIATVQTGDAVAVGLAGEARLAGRLPARAALPLYVDLPAARLAEGVRPEPQ
ncbi:MAG: tRNA (adenosine(37)-N6)-threonylcarbamoyltransferase complex dimerization subunit type 1 TsaB [Acetobacteraceae bacterium]